MKIDLTEMINNGASLDEILKKVQSQAEKEIAEAQAKKNNLANKSKTRAALISAIKNYLIINCELNSTAVDKYFDMLALNDVLKDLENDKEFTTMAKSINQIPKKMLEDEFPPMRSLLRGIM